MQKQWLALFFQGFFCTTMFGMQHLEVNSLEKQSETDPAFSESSFVTQPEEEPTVLSRDTTRPQIVASAAVHDSLPLHSPIASSARRQKATSSTPKNPLFIKWKDCCAGSCTDLKAGIVHCQQAFWYCGPDNLGYTYCPCMLPGVPRLGGRKTSYELSGNKCQQGCYCCGGITATVLCMISTCLLCTPQCAYTCVKSKIPCWCASECSECTKSLATDCIAFLSTCLSDWPCCVFWKNGQRRPT